MYIKSIELSNFRNYEYLSMEFHSEKNILYGDNAQGKTIIVECSSLIKEAKKKKLLK